MLEMPPPQPAEAIVVTASRAPQDAKDSTASVTVIDSARVERLGAPLVGDLLRMVPSLSLTQSGSAGTVAEVRIRGAEANHTLLFIDGIRANDPARGEAPRFELLSADIASRVEVVRGPQSALWGSEAIGGVVAVDGSPGGARLKLNALAETGSAAFGRVSAAIEAQGVSAAVGWQRSDGLDIFGGGDRDGYRNLSARGLARSEVAPEFEVGANGFLLSGRSQFDGSDPYTFAGSHDLASRDRLAAGRIWAALGSPDSDARAKLSVTRLHSRSRNFFRGDEINETAGGRTSIAAQGEHRFATGPAKHLLVLAAEAEREQFSARDTVYFGATEQKRRRGHNSVTAEWRSEVGRVTLDVTVRRDMFSRFRDATSVRGSGLVALGRGVSVAASYGEGIAQPTFFDLFGFFPGAFVGNPSLKSESSKGFELSARIVRPSWNVAASAFRQRLKDEIVETFDFSTFLASTVNAGGASRRSGLELEGGWSPAPALRLSAHYAFLDAVQPDPSGGTLREVRRPKHSGAVSADGTLGRFTYGASIAYVGARIDNNFEIPPFGRVRLDPYVLAGARVAVRLSPKVELFGRVANAFGADYEDVFAYRTEGRSLYAGIRLAHQP